VTIDHQDRREGVDGYLQIGRVDAKARQGPARSQYPETRFKRGLGAQRLDGNIYPASVGDAQDLGDRIDFTEVHDIVGTETTRHIETFRQAIDRDDRRGAEELCTSGGAKSDRPLCEHRHHVADLDPAAFGAAETGRHDVGTHQDLLVGEVVGNEGQVRHRVGNADELRLTAVDGVAELPATDRLAAAL